MNVRREQRRGVVLAIILTGYLLVLIDASILMVALPMVIFGIGQGLRLSTLTTGGMAGVAREDAGVAGGLVNVGHYAGSALGLGILVTVFAAAGSGAHGPQQLLADRISASLTGTAIFVGLALIVTLIGRPRPQRILPARVDLDSRPACAQNPGHPGAKAFGESRAAA